jgi:hypothetical protein
MPGFGLTGSQAVATRPKTAFTWLSEARTLGSPTTSVKVVTDLQHFEEAIRLCNRTSIAFEAFRFENLGFFYGMAERVGIRRKWG